MQAFKELAFALADRGAADAFYCDQIEDRRLPVNAVLGKSVSQSVGLFAALVAQRATDIVPHLEQAVIRIVDNIDVAATRPVLSPRLIVHQQRSIADFCGRHDALGDVVQALDHGVIDE